MAANVGRTVKRWTNFILHDSAGVLRAIPVDSINGVGLTYPEADLTAFQDALKGALPDTPECVIDITGPGDNSVATASPALSGSHTVLSALAGGVTPLSLDVQIGIRHAWEAGEPQFGITKSATSGFLCLSYTVDPGTQRYSAKFGMFPGSSAPAWGVASEV